MGSHVACTGEQKVNACSLRKHAHTYIVCDVNEAEARWVEILVSWGGKGNCRPRQGPSAQVWVRVGVKLKLVWVVWATRAPVQAVVTAWGCFSFHHRIFCPAGLLPELRDKLEISYTEKDTICFHPYVDPEKFNRRPCGRAREKKVREGAKA